MKLPVNTYDERGKVTRVTEAEVHLQKNGIWALRFEHANEKFSIPLSDLMTQVDRVRRRVR